MRIARTNGVAFLAFAALASGLAAPAPAQVVPFDASVYGPLETAWNQYVLEQPLPINPSADTTGQFASIGQSGGVFFLCGSFSDAPVTRNVTVPAGVSLFFPLVTAECSTVEAPPFFGSNFEELSACAASLFCNQDVLSCTIDGVGVKKLRKFRVQSPLHDFTLPGNNIFGLPPQTTGSSVSDGYFLLVSPLSSGSHVIQWDATLACGIGAGFSQHITYNITVQ
jgi:hypothetical protein